MAENNPKPEPDEFCLVSMMFPMVSDEQLVKVLTAVKALSNTIGNCRYEVKVTGNKINGRGLVNQSGGPSPTTVQP